jgi:DNA-binding CsgD family transcriptional regulator
VLVVDQTGRVDFASPAGRAWLALLGTAENDLATGVPTSVWSAMAGLRTMDATTGHAAGTGPVLSVGYRGGRARIESTPGASPDQVAMVISAEAPGRGTDWVAPADLTPAETRITRLVVEGLSNRQIADRLALSENTVQWHLRHIYGKLDVRNRAQLVTRHRVPA